MSRVLTAIIYCELMSFVHLRVHSAYSLAEGAIKIKDLSKQCQKLAIPAVAITDTVNLFGALEFSLTCADAGIQPIIGALVNIQQPIQDRYQGILPEPDQLVLLVQNETGYENLMKIVSDSYLINAAGTTPPDHF